jgi:DNA-binding transcriptional ArsR family regulator
VTTAIDENRLSETFAALSNPTRRAILARLALGATTVNDLAGPFEMTLPAVSKHLKVLERAGLVQRGRQAQFRPVTIEAGPLAEVSGWAEQYRPLWEARFDRMEAHLATLETRQERRGRDAE